MNLKISQTEKQQILEMHKRAVKNNLWEQNATPQQKKPTIQADLNEGKPLLDCVGDFGPGCMEEKTINLYDDAAKTIWDQTWRIADYEKKNYGKQIIFKLDKLFENTRPGTQTGTMTYDCFKPDQFTVIYKGTEPEVSNEPRYNAVTDKLKQYYCPSVLNVKPADADFAQNKSAQSGNAPQTA